MSNAPQQMNGLQDLDYLVRITTIEVVDVEDDPSSQVSTTLMDLMVVGSTAVGSFSKTVRSANLPGSMLPVMSSLRHGHAASSVTI